MRRVAAAMLVILGLSLVSTSATARDEAAEASREGSRSALERWREATPDERREMRARLRDRWADATPRQRRRMGRRMKALERRLPDFSPIERLILLRVAATQTAAERKALRERIAGIDDLEPDQRRALIAELQAMIDGYSAEIDRLEKNKERWQGMSDAERQEVREQMQRLRAMSVEERRALLDDMEKSESRR